MKAKRQVGRSTGFISALITVGLVIAACGSTAGEGPEIPVQDPELFAAGEALYIANCAECHGEDLRGTDLGPSHLSIVYNPNHHTDFAFVQAIKFGSQQHHWRYGQMEPLPGLSDDQIAAIVAFVRENQRIEGFEAYPPP